MKQVIIYLTLALLFLSELYSQSIGGALMVGTPQGEFDKLNPNNGYGIQLQAMLKTPDEFSPIGIGFDAGFLYYSSVNEHRPLSSTIPDVTVEVDRMNSMANAHLVLQVAPYTGFVQPYFEGYIGGSYYFTKTDVKSDYDDEVIFSDVNFDDFAFSYGVGGGLKVLLSNPEYDSEDIYLDFKVRYLNGSEAEYLTKEDIQFNTRTRGMDFSPRRSETDMITYSIGVQVGL